MKQNIIVESISYLFILLFLYTGLSKIIDYSVFKEQIAVTPIFTKTAPIIAWLLPLTEIIVSVLLFLPKRRRIGLYFSAFLMLMFTAYIVYIIYVDEKLPCSCGGIIESLSWKQHLVFNGFMVILAVVAILLSNKINSKKDQISNLSFAH
jgi:uncharacterized membrane protein YphA (DoxX/SURF4 family)